MGTDGDMSAPASARLAQRQKALRRGTGVSRTRHAWEWPAMKIREMAVG